MEITTIMQMAAFYLAIIFFVAFGVYKGLQALGKLKGKNKISNLLHILPKNKQNLMMALPPTLEKDVSQTSVYSSGNNFKSLSELKKDVRRF